MAHILLIDDDVILLKVLSTYLQSVGHSVMTATDGYAALESLEKELYQLIITDATMPNISGFNLAATIRKLDKFKDIPIMFLTSRRDKNDVMKALKLGADDYLVKPVDNDILLAKIEALLDKKRGPLSFVDTPISQSASYTMDFQIIGISEQGITILSDVALPVNFKFQIQTELFEDVGIGEPQLRVVSCDASTTDRGRFNVKINFVGLSQGEHQSIRQWTMARRTQKAS